MDLNFSVPGVRADIHCSRFHFTASALKSVPSWNLTPLLRVRVIVLAPTWFVNPVASHGTGLPVLSVRKSVSTAGGAFLLLSLFNRASANLQYYNVHFLLLLGDSFIGLRRIQ